MGWLINFCKTNPVRAMAIVNALIVLAVAFKLHLSTDQIAAVTGLASVILGLGGELVRSQVTPIATLPEHVAASVMTAANADVPKTPVKELVPNGHSADVKPLFAFMLILLTITAWACGSTGISVKQTSVLSLQVSETSLEGAQNIERSLCFVSPATESGPVCTNPVAAQVGLSKLVDDPQSPGVKIQVHQLMARYFAKAFQDEILAATALIAWRAGDPAPASVAEYQADINQTLLVAQTLVPGVLTQPLVTKIQLAISSGGGILTAVGVK